MVSQEDLEELKQIYFNLYKRILNDEEAIDIATRLVNMFQVIAKPPLTVDSKVPGENNGVNGQ